MHPPRLSVTTPTEKNVAFRDIYNRPGTRKKRTRMPKSILRVSRDPPQARYSLYSKNRAVSFFVFLVVLVLLFWARGAGALDVTDTQCQFLLDEFEGTFIDPGTHPEITTCDTRAIKTMWEQTIQKLYASGNNPAESFADLRALDDARFARLVVNAAAGSLFDTSHPDEASIRIRLGPDGIYERYTEHNENRIVALQMMLILAVLAISATWWRIRQGEKKV